jgi:hypothetical protein
MKTFTTLLFLMSVALCSVAQNVDDKLTSWSKQNPIEKLYVHTDRENYYAGETIWLKGYFMSEFIPSVSNSTLYVELLNNRHRIILKKVFPVYAGTAPGELDLPDTLSSGLYQLRAYSLLMLNQPGFTFNKRIMVYGKENEEPGNHKMDGNSRLTFFPEGGNFITGLLNVVAFKSTDKNGLPLPVEGDIKNSKDELIVSFKSVHDGMGSFSMVPLKNERYHVTVKGSDEKYSLPQQTENGIVFNVTDIPGRKQFIILSGGNNDIFKPAYMIGEIQNHIIFKQSLESDKKEITGFIKTDDFYSGILHLTVFNKDSMPLAERITFIDNKEYVLPAVLTADTLNTGKRERNHFSIALKDTVIGDFSVSVTDADYESAGDRPLNIYSWFLLNSDIRGYVHDPAYYFNATGDSIKKALELVMMTNGWTRFKWTDLAQNKLPQVIYKDPGYIKLSGKINIEGTKKPLADKDIILFISPFDSSKIIKGKSRMLHTDTDGNFETDSIFFYGKMKILFSEVRGKKNKFIRVIPGSDSLHRTYPVALTPLPSYGISATVLQKKMDLDYKDYIHGRGVLLQNVTIKARREKTPLEKLDEEYSTALFSGNIYSRKLDVRNENYGGNIFQYLQERILGLKISGEPGNYSLNYRGGNLSYYLGEDAGSDNKAEPPADAGNVTLFLNEMQTSAVALETIPVSDIALVKLFPTSVMAAGNGAVLAVYTKKGADLTTSAEAPTDMIYYNGYTIVKEFYNPDYERVGNRKPDNRITLKWIPDIFIKGVNQQIPLIFYNNDRTRRFKIVAEGMTSDGRMLMLEKVIEPGK